MNETLELIRSRGYWAFLFRPVPRKAERVETTALPDLLRRAQVSLRGWSFPMIDGRTIKTQFGDGSYESSIEWEHFIEYFKFTSSGQFYHCSAFEDDWPEREDMTRSPHPIEPKKYVALDLLALQLGEVFEFGGRLATELDASSLSIEAVLSNVAGRKLIVRMPMRMPIFREYSTSDGELKRKREYTRAELLSDPRGLAAKMGADICGAFGFKVSADILREIQDSTFSRRR